MNMYKVGQVLRSTEDSRYCIPEWDLDLLIICILDKHLYLGAFDNDVTIYIDDRDGGWEVIG